MFCNIPVPTGMVKIYPEKYFKTIEFRAFIEKLFCLFLKFKFSN